MNTVLRILNPLLLAGILVFLILIFLRFREPISVEGSRRNRLPTLTSERYGEPVHVTIDNEPVQVEISR